MENIAITVTVLTSVLFLFVFFFLLFALGFLIGYKREEKTLSKNSVCKNDNEAGISEKEKKAKKDWDNFLKYDGSVNIKNEY